jgi:UDP-N-acetylmuramoyl-tripeptide--D-alanyl-D-alanine ligase
MKPIDIETLAKVLNAELKNPGSAEVTVVSTDSRTIQTGDCFFAVKGGNFDGHEFIEQAFTNGAVCAVVSKDIENIKGVILKVDDTIKALGELAAWYRKQADFKVIAITGSAGKTTTRQIACHVLKGRFNCHQAPKSFNNNIGVPMTLLGANENDKIIVAELGSNRPGEISALTKIARPDVAVVTNVFPAHLEGFGNIEAIIKEKASIHDGLTDNGKLVINGDIEGLTRYCKAKGWEFTTFGQNADCDITATGLNSDGFCGEFLIDKTKVKVRLAGKANLFNTLAAWAVCREFGVTINDFAEAIKSFEPAGMRLQILKLGNATVINDCYNANPASMANALDCFRQTDRTARKVFICGTMAELGTQSQALHAELGQLIAKSGVDVLLAGGVFAKIVAEEAEKYASEGFIAKVFADTDELCDNLSGSVRSDDIILVKGSRSMELEKAVSVIEKLFRREN